jgi:hypothetical protein
MAEDALVERVGADQRLVFRALDALVSSGEVEALRPISVARSGGARSRRPHYRLRRETDDDYAWQQDVVVRIPASRFFDIHNMEAGRRRRRSGRRHGPGMGWWRRPALGLSR